MVTMENSINVKNLAQSLKLTTFESYDEYVKPGMPIEEALIVLMTAECERRHEAMVKRRIRSAGLPNGKTIDTFKLVPSIPHLKEEHIQSLLSCQFIKDRRNVCALGGNGTGKTHLMAAVCREAIRLGYTVKFIRVSDMLTMLTEANTEKKLGVMMKTLTKVDLLALDELGYITLTIKKAQLLFDVIAKRGEDGSSIFVTSNYEFSRFKEFAGDSVMTRGLVGKLAGVSDILNMNGEDYRIASRKS
jgi:DNA replication protein DnaC